MPGAVLSDAPVQQPDGQVSWLLRELGSEFTLLVFGEAPAWAASLPHVTTRSIGHDLKDVHGWVAQRLDARPGTAYLVRPDQHVCARWRRPTLNAVRSALATATATWPE